MLIQEQDCEFIANFLRIRTSVSTTNIRKFLLDITGKDFVKKLGQKTHTQCINIYLRRLRAYVTKTNTSIRTGTNRQAPRDFHKVIITQKLLEENYLLRDLINKKADKFLIEMPTKQTQGDYYDTVVYEIIGNILMHDSNTSNRHIAILHAQFTKYLMSLEGIVEFFKDERCLEHYREIIRNFQPEITPDGKTSFHQLYKSQFLTKLIWKVVREVQQQSVTGQLEGAMGNLSVQEESIHHTVFSQETKNSSTQLVDASNTSTTVAEQQNINHNTSENYVSSENTHISTNIAPTQVMQQQHMYRQHLSQTTIRHPATVCNYNPGPQNHFANAVHHSQSQPIYIKPTQAVYYNQEPMVYYDYDPAPMSYSAALNGRLAQHK